MHLERRAALVIVSAQLATATRLCAAESCGNEAEARSRLCWRCERKDSVRLHVQAERMPDTLRCCTCSEFKPDDAYSRKSDATHRRLRHHECKQCAKTRRNQARKLGLEKPRAPRTPEQRARQVIANRQWRAQQRELLQQLKQGHS